MSDQTDSITQLLEPYGLSEDEASIYSHLSQKGYQSALAMSRELHMGRTKVYRILDKLIEKHLIEQKLKDRGLKFGATDPVKLEQLVVEKEHAVAALRESLPSLVEKMQSIIPVRSAKSKILYYEGIEGYKQITYNSTKAQGVLRIIERVNDMSDILPQDFSEDMRRKFLKNQVGIRQITPFKNLQPWTDVPGFVTQCQEVRYIPEEKLRVDFEVLVYNDVYAIYSVEGEGAFCVEIYNPELARMQKQIFDFLWESAQKMKFTDDRGSAKIV